MGLFTLAAFQRISTSMWSACCTHLRLLYNAVVRPTITYGRAARPEPILKRMSKVLKIASNVQTASLRAVAGAFCDLPIKELETEIYAPSLYIYSKGK